MPSRAPAEKRASCQATTSVLPGPAAIDPRFEPSRTAVPFSGSVAPIDWLLERSWAEEEREQRRSTVLEVQRLMIEARPMVHLFSGSAYTVVREYVRDSGLDLPGSLARYAYRQWLDLPVDGRPD